MARGKAKQAQESESLASAVERSTAVKMLTDDKQLDFYFHFNCPGLGQM